MRFDRRKDIHPKYLLLTFTIIGIVLIVLSYAAAPKVAGIRRFTSKLITPIQKGINEIGLWTDSKMKNLNEIKTLTDENEALQAELASCKQEITNYQNKMLELQELRDLYDLDESVLNCHGLLPFLLIFSGKWIDDIPDTRGTFYLLLAPSVDLALWDRCQYRQFQIFLHIFFRTDGIIQDNRQCNVSAHDHCGNQCAD